MLSDSKTSTFQRTEQDYYRQRGPNPGAPNGPQPPLADDQAWQANVYQPPHMPDEAAQVQHPWPKPGLQITAPYRERDAKLEKIRRHCEQIRAITYDPATVLEFTSDRLANLKSLAQALSAEIETLAEGLGSAPKLSGQPQPTSGYPSHQQTYQQPGDGYPSLGAQGMFPRPATPQTPPQIVSQPPPVPNPQGYPYDYYAQGQNVQYGVPAPGPNGKSNGNDMGAGRFSQPMIRQPHYDLSGQQLAQDPGQGMGDMPPKSFEVVWNAPPQTTAQKQKQPPTTTTRPRKKRKVDS